MVVMAARFSGKCKRCGRPIAAGTQMEWTKAGGALHLTPEDCERASVAAPPLRGPQPEDPEELMLIVELLLAHPWKSATSKRYEKLPHQYTLRRQWANDADFVWCVEYIRRVGYEQHFIGRVWIYYDIGEHQYWDCGGDPRGPVGARTTVSLINRALKKPSGARPATGR